MAMGCSDHGAFEPVGGPLVQWETGRRVRVPVPGAELAHFAPLGGERALTVPVEDGEAEVPNALLQRGGAIEAWASAGGRALARDVLTVRSRAKPDGYIYTPTEVQTWADVEEWVRGQIAGAGLASAEAHALPAGSEPTAEVEGGTLRIGVPRGDPGASWVLGEGSPSVGGRVGDLYLDTETGMYYRYGEKEQ